MPRKLTRKRKSAPRKKSSGYPKIPLNRRDHQAGEWFAKLVALQALLRGPKGCPWDREQTHASLRRFLIEESYEVLDALEGGDKCHFASELGDLLLQVIFHSILAEETNDFTISDVIESVYTKMVRRHPHVFGDATARDSKAVLKNWEQIKAEERDKERAEKSPGAVAASESILSGVPRSLPAASEAYQLTRKAAKIGFDWDSLAGILDKIDEEKRELLALVPAGARDAKSSITKHPSERVEEEVGDLLFAAVNVARFLELDPEVTLKKANQKFKQRFQWMEAEAAKQRTPLANVPRDKMEELWNRAKKI